METGTKTQTITGVVQRANVLDYEGRRFYFAWVNGQHLQSTDHRQGEDMLSSIGKPVTVTAEPSAKPGKFYVRDFAPFIPIPKAPPTLRTPREEVYKRLIETNLSEVQILKAARALGLVDPRAPSLSGLCKPVFEDILEKWDDVETLAKKEAA